MHDAAEPSQLPLTSWKEIAEHFHRDVRTVQRWERDEGLPVHRHLHNHQASVYGYLDELDAWWRTRERPFPARVSPGPDVPLPPLHRYLAALALVALPVAALFWSRLSRGRTDD